MSQNETPTAHAHRQLITYNVRISIINVETLPYQT